MSMSNALLTLNLACRRPYSLTYAPCQTKMRFDNKNAFRVGSKNVSGSNLSRGSTPISMKFDVGLRQLDGIVQGPFHGRALINGSVSMKSTCPTPFLTAKRNC